MSFKAAENYPNDELDEVATIITDFLDEPEEVKATSEYDAWVFDLLDLYDDNDRSQDDYMVDMNLTDLSNGMKDLSTYATFAVYYHLLLDTGF